ncbi:MAG TPA: VOC family protein [Asanoa sp.]
MDIVTAVHPRLVVSDAAGAIEFYTRAFGAVERAERYIIEGKVAHAEVTIGGSVVYVKDESDGDPSPTTLGGTPVILSLEVGDSDRVARRMLDNGARVIFEVGDHGYGYRDGRLADPYGHLWIVSQKI